MSDSINYMSEKVTFHMNLVGHRLHCHTDVQVSSASQGCHESVASRCPTYTHSVDPLPAPLPDLWGETGHIGVFRQWSSQ